MIYEEDGLIIFQKPNIAEMILDGSFPIKDYEKKVLEKYFKYKNYQGVVNINGEFESATITVEEINYSLTMDYQSIDDDKLWKYVKRFRDHIDLYLTLKKFGNKK